MEHKSSVYYFISWRSFYLFNLSTDHEEDHIIDKLEVKNFFEELDLVRRLHGNKINTVNTILCAPYTMHCIPYTLQWKPACKNLDPVPKRPISANPGLKFCSTLCINFTFLRIA